MSKQARTACVFCGDFRKITKQHIIPDRLKRIIDISDGNSSSQTLQDIAVYGDTASYYPKFMSHNRPLRSRKLHCVCAKCNNGWLSLAESKGFEVAEALIRGSTARLDVDAQKRIALLAATMFVMVDLDDKRTSAVTQFERTYIFQNKIAPPNWHLFIGRTNCQQWRLRFRHHGLSTVMSENLKNFRRHDTQISTIGMGNLLLHVVSSSSSNIVIDAEKYAEDRKILCIPINGIIDFSKMALLDSRQSDRVADSAPMNVMREPEIKIKIK